MTDDWMEEVGGNIGGFDQQTGISDLDMETSDISESTTAPIRSVRRPPVRRTQHRRQEDASGSMSDDDPFDTEQYDPNWDSFEEDTMSEDDYSDDSSEDGWSDDGMESNWGSEDTMSEDAYSDDFSDDFSEDGWSDDGMESNWGSDETSFEDNGDAFSEASESWDGTFDDATDTMFTQETDNNFVGDSEEEPPKKIGKVGTAIVIAIVLVVIALGIKIVDGMKITKKEETKPVQETNVEQKSVEQKTQEDLVREQSAESDRQDVDSGDKESQEDPVQEDVNDTSVEPAEKQGVTEDVPSNSTDSISMKIVPNSMEVDYTKDPQTAEGTVTGKERYLKDGQLIYNVIVTVDIGGETHVVNYYCGYSVFKRLNIGDFAAITYQQVSKTVISVSGIANIQ